MAVPFYMDVHVPQTITDQLRQSGVDVLTVIEDGRGEADDAELLERARMLGRVLFTQDIRFRVRAEDWQRQGRDFAGLVFAHPLRATIGQLVFDLELIAQGTTPADWHNVVAHLPL
jgi:hypothetical protein